MSSLMALLSQQTPNLKTRKALILLGLQNDFLRPDGKLPVHSTDFVANLHILVPAFRQYGDIIWVRSEYEANRLISGPEDEGNTVVTSHLINDEEHFLSRTSSKSPGCVKGSYGADFADPVVPMIEAQDMKIVKSHYSAFGSTNLLLTLRSRLITELYICGCLTNMSVYATAVDAARYGIKIYLVEDCLGYRRKERHDQALKRLHDFIEANSTMSSRVIEHLRKPPSLHDYSDEDDSFDDDDDDDEEDEEDDEDEDRSHRQRVQHFSKGSPDGPIAVDSDPSDDEIILPNLSGLNMRDFGRDIVYPRPLSSRSLPMTGDRRSPYRTSKIMSSYPGSNVRETERYTKTRSRDSKLSSPAQSEISHGANQSQQSSPARYHLASATKGISNIIPLKRNLNPK